MKRTHAGTALVICLILLVVLTLLATSTMSTAALQLTMAGNDQYVARAFEAAETGIESAIATLPASMPSSTMTLSGALENGDTYSAIITPRGSFPPPPGYLPTFTASHFEIESTGRSLRDTRATHIQGVFIVQPPAAASTQTTPPLCMPGMEILPNICVESGTPVRTWWRPAK